MQFWRGNKIDGAFEQPVDEVARQFVSWYDAQPEEERSPTLERDLRHWLTSKVLFNSVWQAEKGPESFDSLWNECMDLIYGKHGCKACDPASRAKRHTCGLAGLQAMMPLG